MGYPRSVNNVARDQSNRSIHRNSCSVAYFASFRKSAFSFPGEKSKLWRKNVMNHCTVTVIAFSAFVLRGFLKPKVFETNPPRTIKAFRGRAKLLVLTTRMHRLHKRSFGKPFVQKMFFFFCIKHQM